MKRKTIDTNKCFVCDREVSESGYRFINVKLCSNQCKYTYFTTHDKEIIANREKLKDSKK